MRTFEKPFCEVVYFGNSIITISGCDCVVAGIPMPGTNDVCTGANAQCTCSNNQSVPGANCE